MVKSKPWHYNNKNSVAFIGDRGGTLGLEGTHWINWRIFNYYGNGSAGMAAFQTQERP